MSVYENPTRAVKEEMPRQIKSGRNVSSSRPHARTIRWSQRVTETSNALTLDAGVFKLRSAKRIAESLMRSARKSHRRKMEPYRSAMSMLTFYINRAGRHLSEERRKILERAKDEL